MMLGVTAAGIRRLPPPHPIPVAAFPRGHGGRTLYAGAQGHPQYRLWHPRPRKRRGHPSHQRGGRAQVTQPVPDRRRPPEDPDAPGQPRPGRNPALPCWPSIPSTPSRCAPTWWPPARPASGKTARWSTSSRISAPCITSRSGSSSGPGWPWRWPAPEGAPPPLLQPAPRQQGPDRLDQSAANPVEFVVQHHRGVHATGDKFDFGSQARCGTGGG